MLRFFCKKTAVDCDHRHRKCGLHIAHMGDNVEPQLLCLSSSLDPPKFTIPILFP